ncbi:Sperm protamine P1 (modular protein) [Mesorhizobium sp. ORS 3324]|nr:Sperm protamine P1 (modular protein) [Mesorhizobium sp. ORS 3324]
MPGRERCCRLRARRRCLCETCRCRRASRRASVRQQKTLQQRPRTPTKPGLSQILRPCPSLPHSRPRCARSPDYGARPLRFGFRFANGAGEPYVWLLRLATMALYGAGFPVRSRFLRHRRSGRRRALRRCRRRHVRAYRTGLRRGPRGSGRLA